MIIFRASLLVLLTLLLVGCATTSSEGKDKYGEQCQYLEGQPHVQTNSFQKKVDTSEKTELYDLVSKKEFSGIEKVYLNVSKLTIQLIDKSLFEQYTSPKVLVVNENQYEAHPVKGFAGTIITAGTLWLFAPQKYSNFTFGCTEQVLMDSQLDQTRKTKTGKTEWREVEKAHKFLVSGFNKDYIFDIYMGSYERLPLNNQALINLSEAILNTDFTKTTTIKITCLDCDLLGEEEQALYKYAKKTVEITADFRAIKADLIVEAEKKKVAQVKHDKEVAIQRVVQAKEDLQRKKEAQSVPLNEFKAQCQELGFKLGSKEFGNCVLELNEAK